MHSHWIPWRLHLFPFADCNSRHGSTRMQASHVRCGSSELEVMMHTCIHCLCWRAKASTNHKPPKATSARLFQLSSVDNSPEHFFGANSSELSPSPLCSACPFWICSRTHVAEALVASDILNLLMFRSVFKPCDTATGMEWSLIRTTSQIFAWLRSVREQNMQKPSETHQLH